MEVGYDIFQDDAVDHDFFGWGFAGLFVFTGAFDFVQDFGDVANNRVLHAACSDSHGGLGGF